MSSFKVFLRWYNNTDVVPIFEAMQKMMVFYHDKDIDMLKLGFTLPNLANICLHNSTDAKLYSFTETDKHQLQKIRDDVVGGPSVVFTRKVVVYETFIRMSTNICKSIVGIPANYTPTRCVNPCPAVFIRVWISIQKPVDSNLDKTRPVAFKTWSCLIFNEQDLIVKLRASTVQADKRKKTASMFMGLVLIAVLCLKQWDASITFVPGKSYVNLSLKKISNVAVRK